jgi:two-component system, OmpR family, response regulator
MNILLIDDNQSITTMFAKYFKLSGHEVQVANTGQNGLALIQNDHDSIVLLDLAIPDFSGLDIVNHLHKNNKMNSRKIVALTASSVTDAEKEELLQKGVHSILRKPIDPDELLRYLEKIK